MVSVEDEASCVAESASSEKKGKKKVPASQVQSRGQGRRAGEHKAKIKTILVTGAGGELARQVVNRLKRQYNIVAVDFRQRVKLEKRIPSYRVNYHKRAFEDIFRNHQIDAVIHLGRMSLFESDHYHRYNVNVLGTQKLLDLCKKYGVRQVMVLSTYFVYGASPYNPALITEDYPLKVSELTMDLVDSVELENLATIYLWKHKELNITILRPCNIAGPGVLNSMSMLLSKEFAPKLLGFSPMMQFIHVEDMADAIVLAYEKNIPGIYNVATEDWISYKEVLRQCGCKYLPIPSLPQRLPRKLTRMLNWRAFPSYLVNYYKYPVIIDGSHFSKTFGFKPRRNLADIFSYYRDRKQIRVK